ncbi:cyclic nucleotide-binding-like protein [Chlamydoabsidia padenii]|nr:cyclic nucleotide-binding-like protein [Chlamydoabsidia padenii]
MEQDTITSTTDYPADLLSSLRHHSLFQRIDNEAFLTTLASGMHVRIYNPRDIIITKGETSKAMFFLLRGQVEVCSADFERTYATLSQGACFGEIGILYARPRTATVVASMKCTVAALTLEQVDTLLPLFPDVEKIIRFEAEERMAMMDKMEQNRQQEQAAIEQQESLTASDTTSQKRSSIQNNVESFCKTGIRNHLEKIPFFYGCSDNFLHEICLSIQPRYYDPNTIIYNQGDQGDEMYFIVDGYVDVDAKTEDTRIYGRLGPGGYFGDSLVLLDKPCAATIKTVEQVELYVLNRVDFKQVCDLFPEAADKLKLVAGTRLNDFNNGKLDNLTGIRPTSLNEDRPPQTSECRPTCDQDPTLPMTPATQLRKAETRKRRASIAVWNDPILVSLAAQKVPMEDDDDASDNKHDNHYLEQSNRKTLELPPSPIWTTQPPSSYQQENDNVDLVTRIHSTDRFTTLEPRILIHIMDLLDYWTLIQLMRLNLSMRHIFTLDLSLNHIDLSTIHKKITDDTLTSLILSLHRPIRSLSLSQCFHLTDSCFRSLLLVDMDTSSTQSTLQHLHTLDLNSCWLLTDQTLQLLGEQCPQLCHLDLSNCRKITNAGMSRFLQATKEHNGTGLEWLSLSYCKNLTDMTMQHLADYTRDSLVYLNLQRCTKITDQGFIAWGSSFSKLKEIILVDCSFLTDRAIQCLTQAAGGLERVSLSFCCSLSDTAMYHLAHLHYLVDLDVSFCGAAVSDVSLNLLVDQGSSSLKRLNIRGCVRVTGDGLLSFLSTIKLIEINISQCPSISTETKQKIMDLSLVQHLIF